MSTKHSNNETTLCWSKLHSVPIKDFLAINGNDDEFWIISKQNSFDLEIFNYNVNENTFSKYPHKIDTKSIKVLTASFNKQDKILYIISMHEIIILDIGNNKHHQIAIDVRSEHCACTVYEGQLHIIGDIGNIIMGVTSYYVLNKEKNTIQFVYQFTENQIKYPRIVEFTVTHDNMNNIDMKQMQIFGTDNMHFYTEVSQTNQDSKWDAVSSPAEWELFQYPFIKTKNEKYSLFFKQNRIILKQYRSLCCWSNINVLIIPTHCILCKESVKENNLLLVGYIKKFVIKQKIIPMDIIDLITYFYSSYNVHILDENGKHYKISIDKIINNAQKYTGIIRSYNKTNKTGIIQINGKLNEFSGSQNRLPLINEVNDLNKPLINALKNMFERFATNNDDTMSIDDMKQYILYCGAGESSASTSRIKMIFSRFGKSQIKLSSKGFISFYAAAIRDRPEHVINDLDIFGYKENILCQANGQYINASFDNYNDNQLNEENNLVDFDIITDKNGNKNAINVTKINAGQY